MRTSSLLTLATALCLTAASAFATDFQLSPVRLDTDAKQRSVLLTVRNGSRDKVRLQVSAFVWKQGPGGEVELVPTRDVSFFPSLLSLASGDSRHIRIGTPGEQGAVEKTYRIIVEQLPDMDPSVGGIRVLTRMSIPLFVAPLKPTASARIKDISVNAGKLTFGLENTGSIHVLARTAKVRGFDAKGREILNIEIPGWYVLTRTTRPFELLLSTNVCEQLHDVSIDVESDAGTHALAQELPEPKLRSISFCSM